MKQEVVEPGAESCRVSLQCVDAWENISALTKKDCPHIHHRCHAIGMSCERIDNDPGSRWWEVMTFPLSFIKFVSVSVCFELFDVCFFRPLLNNNL